MSVYVDKARIPYGRMVMCHMVADTLDELHSMAERIGLKRDWFQAPPKASIAHYDVALGRRTKAIELGAIALGRHNFVAKVRDIRNR